MEHSRQSLNHDIDTLADDARVLMAATADVAGEKVAEARKRLGTALESGKRIIGRVTEKSGSGAKATNEAVHEHPYVAIGVALGAGLLLGYLFGNRRSHKGD